MRYRSCVCVTRGKKGGLETPLVGDIWWISRSGPYCNPGFLHFSFPLKIFFFYAAYREPWIVADVQSEQRHQNDGFGSSYPRAWSSHISEPRRMGHTATTLNVNSIIDPPRFCYCRHVALCYCVFFSFIHLLFFFFLIFNRNLLLVLI